MDRTLGVSGGHSDLRGRASECAVLDALLEDLRRGQSRSLVLRGEAGIGKTELLRYLLDSASGVTTARAVGVESEMELAYASLHQLCAPLLDRLPTLPAPQCDALEAVFGLKAGASPDRFLVGLGVLGLLCSVGEERPFLCVVDDAQWLDHASALTLAFVAHRLQADPVAIVFAAREPEPALRHLPELEIRGLHNGDARALLGAAVRFNLDERVRDRIIAETRGNPLALLELPRGLSATEVAAGFGLADADDLSRRIEQSFLRQLDTLSEDARRLLLMAAAEPVGDPVLLWRAAQQLGIEPSVADLVESEGLLAIGDQVIFRHPLLRSAVYRSSVVEDRRAVHLALAKATDPQADPDRRAWHLAEATAGPDERVAEQLERSASRAQARGGAAAAAAFLKRSVALTLDPVRRTQRALAAAQGHLDAGAFDAALLLLKTAEAGSPDELGRARVELLRGRIEALSSFSGEAAAVLLGAAKQLEPLDAALARETYLDAWGAAMYAGRAGAEVLLEVSLAARSAPQPTSAACLRDLLLDGLSALVIEGRAAAEPMLSRVLSLFADGEIATEEALRWGWMATIAPRMLWDLEHWHAINDRLRVTAREAGLLAHLPIYLYSLGSIAIWCGDLAAAASLSGEADAIAEATGTRLVHSSRLMLAAWRGQEAEASALIDVEAKNASTVGQGLGIQYCHWVSGVLYNGLGRYERALGEAQQASKEAPELWTSACALVELVEAAARTGKTGVAGEALARLGVAASIGNSDWGLGVLARSRGILSEGDDAEGSYREAIARLSRTQLRPELARAHLVYGEWLRRGNRRVDARAQLRIAHELFASIGMEAFAERTRGELQATGERVRAHTVETRDDLTEQERQIAEFARHGLTNPEIGARLFLSPRTVEWHLRNVFTKLGIRSRRELSRALPSPDSAFTLT